MRTFSFVAGGLFVLAGCFAAFWGAQAQPTAKPVVPATFLVPGDRPAAKPRDHRKLPEAAQTIHFSALRASEWLKLTNKPDGRFVYGFQPSLRVQLEGDNFQSQAGATFALARAAHYFRDAGGETIVRQAALSLLLETMADPRNADIRHTAAIPTLVNRLSSHGLFLSAVHELSAPGKDLLDAAEQMANYLKHQQQADGSLVVTVDNKAVRSASAELDAEHAGHALHGIARSQKHRPAPWKAGLLAKARAHYFAQWQANKTYRTVCSHSPAYAEMYLQTKEAAYADAVFAMNDWLMGLQYRPEFETQHKHWAGGFASIRDGKLVMTPPDIESARAAHSLAAACRVARHAGDLPRLQRYERAFLQSANFLMSLQYAGKKTEHFVESFRPSILGAFHASHQDGSLRLDYTQHALCAMVQYLETVSE